MHSGKKLFEIDFNEILTLETTQSLRDLDKDLTKNDSIFQIVAIEGDGYNTGSGWIMESYSSAYYIYGNQLLEERFAKIFVQDSVHCLFRSFYADGLINTEIHFNNGADSMLTSRYKKEVLVDKKVYINGLYLYKISYDKNGEIKSIKDIYQTPEKRAKPREFPIH